MYSDSEEMYNLVVLPFNSLSGGPLLRKIEPCLKNSCEPVGSTPKEYMIISFQEMEGRND